MPERSTDCFELLPRCCAKMGRFVAATIFLVVAALAALVKPSSGYLITCEQKRAVIADIRNTILSKKELDEDGNEFLPFIASFPRLAFHSCTGRLCLGCINLQDSSNLHLSDSVRALQAVQRRNPFIRHGDLWAWASIVALQMAEEKANDLFGRSQTFMRDLLRFRLGRFDCFTAPFTNEFFPFATPIGDLNHVLTFMADNFDFTKVESVAILGCHRLGGLRNPQSTQIVNQWVANPQILDNGFYINLVNGSNRWAQAPHSLCGRCLPLVFFTNAQNRRLMFNTDMSLFKDIRLVSASSGVSSCRTFDACSPSETASIVLDFASSNDRWLRIFAPTFMKMIEMGYLDEELDEVKNC